MSSQDAKEGADYAQQQYEKYNTAYNDASKSADNLRHQNDAERQSLLDEQSLIQEIMRLVGPPPPTLPRPTPAPICHSVHSPLPWRMPRAWHCLQPAAP